MDRNPPIRRFLDNHPPTRPWTVGLVILICTQILFWMTLGLLEYLAQPPASSQPASVDVRLTDTHLATTLRTTLNRTRDPAFLLQDPSRAPDAIFEYPFNLEQTTPLGLYLGWTRNLVEVRINGETLRTQMGDEIWGQLSGFEPAVIPIPERFTVTGKNLLEIKAVGGSRKILPNFALGGYAEMTGAYRWGNIITVDLVYASIGVLLFVSLLLALMTQDNTDPTKLRMLILLMLMWCFRNACFAGLDSHVPHDFSNQFHFITTYLFLGVIAAFSLSWLGYTRRWLYAVAAVTALALLSLTLPADNVPLYFRRGFTLETYLTVAACGVSVLLFSWHVARDRSLGIAEYVLFVMCFMAVLTDLLDDRFNIVLPVLQGLHLTFYSAPAFGLLLGLGMAATLARQGQSAQRVIREANVMLNTALAEREQELEAAYTEREYLRTAQAVEQERQRIVRDMHDGLSGQLTGLIAVSQDLQADRATIVDGLRVGLDELRMIVHSLDATEDSLAQSLGSYRARVRDQIESLGIEFRWHASPAVSELYLQPAAVLNIYRFIQECVHNAVKHANAEVISVELSTQQDSLRVTVNDSGKGLPLQPTRGRGLNNLEIRAERLQGELDIHAKAGLGGALVALSLPLEVNR